MTGIGQVRDNQQGRCPKPLALADTSQQSRCKNTGKACEPQQLSLGLVLVGPGAKPWGGDHHQQITHRENQGPCQGGMRGILHNNSNKIGIKNGRQNNGGVTRIRKVKARPCPELSALNTRL